MIGKANFKIIRYLMLFAVLVSLSYVFIKNRIYNNDKSQVTKTESGEYQYVKRVVDGDTFLMSDGERVRLLGIDTPEKYESQKLDKDAEISNQDKKTIQKLGEMASDYAKELVEGKKVKLVREPNYQDRDKYGRLLRYVYLEDGTLINAKIIQDGFAQVYDRFPISKLDEFRKYQKEARENNRGLWGDVEGLKQFSK
jgi:micrococcal nuclease